MRPFIMKSPAQFLPDGPTALTSEEWVAELNATRLFGDVNSTIRTPAQSENRPILGGAYRAAVQSRLRLPCCKLPVGRHEFGGLLAMLWTGYADAGIACWNAKYTYSFWRPVTAIRAGDCNSELNADTNWTSLGTTPNHPEYPAAHGCATGVTSSLVENFFGTRRVRVVVDSTAFSDGVHTHTFFSTADWYHEVYWARIFAGFHFDHSLVDGGAIGRQVAAQLASKHFRRRQRQGENENHDRK